jgi:2-hydroxy-3-oxopropionate reductase
MTHHIAFLGTGIMFAPMTANLMKAGFKAAVWNRTRSKTDPLAAQGARVAGGPVDCVKGVDYILSILDSGPVVRELPPDCPVTHRDAPRGHHFRDETTNATYLLPGGNRPSARVS